MSVGKIRRPSGRWTEEAAWRWTTVTLRGFEDDQRPFDRRSFLIDVAPGQLWDTLNNDASQYLFAETPLNWGSLNNGNLYGYTLYAGGPAPLANLQPFTESFGYDTVNRLTAASDSGGWSRSFGYDAYGNLWVTGASNGPWSGNTPVANVFTAANQISGVSYDAAGNQLQVNGNTLAYDAENRMTAVSESGATETLAYDGAGQRVQKTLPGAARASRWKRVSACASRASSSGRTLTATKRCRRISSAL